MTGAQPLINQGREELLFEQLQFKFGPLEHSTDDKIRSVPAEELLRVAKMLIMAGSLEELGL